MTPNTEPIPVKDALRLCEIAIEDCEMHYNWHKANGTKGAR